MTLTGFHGTDTSLVKSIKEKNFYLSSNVDDWLGKGVYFFIEGITCPIKNACEWAANQAYDKRTHSYKYKHYVVLEAQIMLDEEKVFDTRDDKALVVFNELRDAIIKKHNKLFQQNNELHENDRIIWDIISSDNGLEGIIHNLYIKDKFQRINRVHSNVPNTTVLCVKDASSIDVPSIKQKTRGSVFSHELR